MRSSFYILHSTFFILLCVGCVTTTTVVSEPQRSSLNPSAAPSGVSALRVHVDAMGGLSFNDRLYATPDLAHVLRRQKGSYVVELIGQEGVTQAQLEIVAMNLSRHGVHKQNINMVTPRRATATTAE